MSGNLPPAPVVSANGVGAISDATLNTYVIGAVLLADLRNFVGITKMTAYMVGTNSPGDGGQGHFVWNASSIAADDGGVSTIAPNGTLVGRWIKLVGPQFPAVRTYLKANTTWYVDATNGNDSNNGLAPLTNAFATVQAAIIAIASQYDGGGHSGTISIAAGSYNVAGGLLIAEAFVGFSSMTLQGPAATGGAVLTSTGSVLTVQGEASVNVAGGIQLSTLSTGVNIVQADYGGQIFLQAGVSIGPAGAGGVQLYATRFGYIEVNGNISVNAGTSGNLVQASHQGNFRLTTGALINFVGASNYTDVVLYSLNADITITDTAGFTGTNPSGVPYRAAENGLIQWALGTGTRIPGVGLGSEVMGGRYYYGTGLTTLEWATGSFTVNMATIGSGTVTVPTNFIPGSIDFIAAVLGATGTIPSIGWATMTTSGSGTQVGSTLCVSGGTQGAQPAGGACIEYFTTSGGVGISASVSSVLTNGVVLTFSTAGSPTGTLTVYFRAKRGL